MAKFKLNSPIKIDPVARYEVAFQPDNIQDDSGLVAKANKNGTMIVNKNIPKDSKLRKEAESHEDHHLKDMMEGKLDYDGEKVYEKISTGRVKEHDRSNFQESDRNLPWEKEAYKAGERQEKKDMRPNPNKLDAAPNMYERDTPLAFQKIGSRHEPGRESDINKISHNENFGPSMKKSWDTASPFSKKEGGPGGNVSVISGAAPGSTPSGVTEAKKEFDDIKDYNKNSLTSIGQEALNPDFTFKALDGEMYSNKADYLKASQKALNKTNKENVGRVLSSFQEFTGDDGQIYDDIAGGGQGRGSGTPGGSQNYTDEDFEKGLLIAGVPGSDKGVVPMSNKFYDALQFPAADKGLKNPLTPKISKSNKNTSYVTKSLVDEGKPLSPENFGFDIGDRSGLKPIDVKQFNTATFDVNKGVIKTQMADKGKREIDASKTKSDLVNVSTPEIQIRDIADETYGGKLHDFKVNEKLSNLSAKRSDDIGTRKLRNKVKKGPFKKKHKVTKRKGLEKLGINQRPKVEKLSGVVDLDMSGKVDSDIERNARAFIGGSSTDKNKYGVDIPRMDNTAKIYSNRRDARRSIKGRKQAVEGAGLKNIGRIKTKALQGRDFEYTQNGKVISESDFVGNTSYQRNKIKKKENIYNTNQLNAGAGITSLKGDNSFANKFKVNYPSATGQGEVNRLNQDQIKNINFDQYSKKQKKKINKRIKKINNG